MKIKVINQKESVIYRNAILRYGDEADMDEEVAKSLMERGYVEIHTDNPDLYPQDEVEEVGAENHASEEKSLDSMSYQELKSYAKEHGINASGTKDELIQRIAESTEKEDADDEATDEAPMTSMPEDE